ncbi:hypothetical protein EPO15_00860 [bacterium]|nr:MAG: hypothetical protein EPO15_00860 [bacterium]
MTAAAALGLALLLAPAARASDAPSIEGREADVSGTDLVRRMKAALAEDPAKADALAARILRSSLGPRLSESADPDLARGELRAWIVANPAAAAHLAVGFARDDAAGTDAFERSLYRRAEHFLELSPDRNKGILGRLDGLGKASKAIKADEGMSDDDRRKLMKDLFEGQGAMNAQAKDLGPGGAGPAAGGGAVSSDGVYDRLSAVNPAGYSPLVQALQSELNRSAAPGAPRLIETGKLDYPTLVFPSHPVRYDLERLEAAAALTAAAHRANALGERRTPEQLADPAVQKDLEGRAAGGLPAALGRRREALSKARTALNGLLAAAEPAKQPKNITPAMLKTLSAKRRDAARWIQLAALEEVLGVLEGLTSVRDAALKESLARAPADAEERARFWEGGGVLEAQAADALEKGRRARELLSDRDDDASWGKAEGLLKAARAAAKRLPEEAAAYRSAPERLRATAYTPPRWRAWAEDAALKWAPGTAFAKEAASRRKLQLDARVDFARFMKAQ